MRWYALLFEIWESIHMLIMEDTVENRIPNFSLMLNESLELEKMSEILGNFYNELGNEIDYVLIILYIPVIILAVIANLMVIIVVLKYQYMRSVTNYFVVNLSIADLLVTTICMPMAVSQAISIIWMYGETMCKLFYYLQGVAVAASVFTITAMSIDRYLAIRSPLTLRRVFNRKSTIMIIAALWLIALSIFGPVLPAVTLQSPDIHNITLAGELIDTETVQVLKPRVFQICSEDFKSVGIHAHVFGIICFVLVYAIPGFVVILAYSLMGRTLCARKPPFDCDSVAGSASSQQGFRLVRERKRVAWILLTLAVLFALCWLPYNVLRLFLDLGIIHEGGVIPKVLSYCLFLGHANSALNPVVYCFMTRNFRRSITELLSRSARGFNRNKSQRNNIGRSNLGAGLCVGSGVRNCGWDNKRRTRKFVTSALPHPAGRQILNKNATSSSGYNNSYDRHSPHRRCYMLKNIQLRKREATNPRNQHVGKETAKIAAELEPRFGGSLSDGGKPSGLVFHAEKRSQSLHALSSAVHYQPAYESINQTTFITNVSQSCV